MIKRISSLLIMFSLLLSARVSAQTHGRVPTVVDSSDSLAFEEMRNRMDSIRVTRPTVAVVLAGGGALGAAHAGALKYIDELGIPVDLVVGTSMGGLMGGMYSLGYSGNQIDSLLRSVDWNIIMSDSVPGKYYDSEKRKRVEKYVLDVPFWYDDADWIRRQSLGTGKLVKDQTLISSISEGYLYGVNVYNLFTSKSVGYHSDMSFLDLPTPFVCTSTDLATGKEKNLTDGSVVDAIRATMAIPFAFFPIRMGEKVLVDGGLCNNFPVDVARAMGADVVIGVDLYLPNTREDASSSLQMTYMGMTQPGAALSYDNNVKDADIYIAPDMSKYNLLSFNDSAIATLIDRGYVAAVGHKKELQDLAKRTGTEGRELNGKKSTDIAVKAVKINSLEFEGLDDEEMDYFIPKLGLKAGRSYTASDFEAAVARVYGTGAFSRVKYELLGDSEPYRFVLICERGPMHSLLLGLRADTEGIISAAFGIGFGVNRLWGHRLSFSGTVGKYSNLRVDWKYVPESSPSMNAYALTSFSAFKGMDVPGQAAGALKSYRGEFWHNELGFYANENNFDKADFDAGFKIENTPVLREFGEGRDVLNNWKSYWAYAFLRFSYNSVDNKYFPTSGWRLSAEGDYLMSGYNAVYGERTKKTKYASLEVLVPITFAERFTVIPAVYSRFIFNADERLASYYMGNVVGGAMAGRYFAHQIAFIGYNGVKRVGDSLGLASLDLRFKASSKLYFSLIGQMYNDSIGNEGWKALNIYAAAVQASMKTMLGPITANIHWNSDTKNVGFYIGAGFDF